MTQRGEIYMTRKSSVSSPSFFLTLWHEEKGECYKYINEN